MSFGSYYQSTPGYYRNPVPYTETDYGAPVPGWGTSVSVAGPARVGVGQIDPRLAVKASSMLQPAATAPRPVDAPLPAEAPPPAGEPLPWWIWPVAAAVVMGGIGFYGTKKGWL